MAVVTEEPAQKWTRIRALCTPTPTSLSRPASWRNQLWLWPNLLSLDAPLIAVLWQLLLMRSLSLHVSRGEPAVLALCVWSVYIADRVLDVLRAPGVVREPARHRFYRRHLRLSASVALCLLTAAVPVAYWLLRRSTFYAGLWLGIPMLAYFGFVHLAPAQWRPRWPRELVIASLFTLGILVALWTADGESARPLWAPGLLFGLLCWANCCAIETWEWKRGASSAGAPGVSTRWVAYSLPAVGAGIAALALAVTATAATPVAFGTAACLSGLALAVLALRSARLPLGVLRVVADLVLCTPLPFLLFMTR